MKWQADEIEFLKQNYGCLSIKNIASELGRTESSIKAKVAALGLKSSKIWTAAELEYFTDNWGTVSLPSMAKRLGRSVGALKNQAARLGLGPFLNNGDYITFNQLFKCLGKGGFTWTKKQWTDKGLPIKKKRVEKNTFDVVYLDAFWEWAQANQTLIDFSKLEEGVLGKEPDWLKDQRKNDIQLRLKYTKEPWTPAEDRELERLVKLHRYGYREISDRLRRTEGAIKKRLLDLGIKDRPVRRSPHEKWRPEQLDKLKDLYNRGYDKNIICFYIDGKSAHACGGKIEVLIRQGELFPRSEFRVSC